MLSSRVKVFIVTAYARWHAFILRCRGVQVGKGTNIVGCPRIKISKGASIIIGADVCLNSNLYLAPLITHAVGLYACRNGAQIVLKDHCGISGALLLCKSRISVGEYTFIGPGTVINDSEGHTFSKEYGWATPGEKPGRPISIGDKCFIAGGCTILSGVTIGDRCLISAGTVLKCDVPAGHMASGNPAVITPLPKILGGPGRKKIATTSTSE
ncbi:MAG: acyltransferase [Akkermansia sp.]|nr:acyltransferase [Akkermansia sp.]